MSPYSEFASAQWLPFRAEKVFRFFADPENLPLLMPAWQAARIESTILQSNGLPAGSESSLAGVGSVIHLSFRPFPLSPVRLHWVAVIERVAWNSYFIDVQKSGPFAYWRHRHVIAPAEKEGRSGSVVRDEIRYRLPLGALGRLADPLFIREQLRRTFAYRHCQASKFLEGGQDAAATRA